MDEKTWNRSLFMWMNGLARYHREVEDRLKIWKSEIKPAERITLIKV